MTNALESSEQKIAWAEKRFLDLQREINNFGQLDAYKEVIEPHPDKPGHQVRKIRLTQPLPPDIAHITAEVVNNLRSALDAAGYAIALASGKTAPKSTAFPFAGSVTTMAAAIGGRCKDIPAPIQSLFFGFQPYCGGDDLLWALNEVCNTEKHKIVIPIGTVAAPASTSIRGTGFFEVPQPHKWDSAKNEMVLVTLGPESEFDYEFIFRMFVGFGDIRIVGGWEVLQTLGRFGAKVNSILAAINAECRRIGLFT